MYGGIKYPNPKIQLDKLNEVIKYMGELAYYKTLIDHEQYDILIKKITPFRGIITLNWRCNKLGERYLTGYNINLW